MRTPSQDFTRQLLAYPFTFPSIGELSIESLRRHAGHALSVNRFDIAAEYQAEIDRRELTERKAAA